MSPDGPQKPSPEERLLKLIRGKGAAQAPSAANTVVGAVAAKVLGGSGNATAAKPRWPMLAGGTLVLIILIELGYLVAQMARPMPRIETPALPDIPAAAPGAELPPPVEVPSISGSLTRPLFVSSLSGGLAQLSPDAARPAGPSTAAKDLAVRLTLMGIVDGDPAQAIIEDGQTKKTYFVTAGQPVAEGAVLETVQSNRVILDLNGEKVALSL